MMLKLVSNAHAKSHMLLEEINNKLSAPEAQAVQDLISRVCNVMKMLGDSIEMCRLVHNKLWWIRPCRGPGNCYEDKIDQWRWSRE